jgi:hypothetical protein
MTKYHQIHIGIMLRVPIARTSMLAEDTRQWPDLAFFSLRTVSDAAIANFAINMTTCNAGDEALPWNAVKFANLLLQRSNLTSPTVPSQHRRGLARRLHLTWPNSYVHVSSPLSEIPRRSKGAGWLGQVVTQYSDLGAED